MVEIWEVDLVQETVLETKDGSLTMAPQTLISAIPLTII